MQPTLLRFCKNLQEIKNAQSCKLTRIWLLFAFEELTNCGDQGETGVDVRNLNTNLFFSRMHRLAGVGGSNAIPSPRVTRARAGGVRMDWDDGEEGHGGRTGEREKFWTKKKRCCDRGSRTEPYEPPPRPHLVPYPLPSHARTKIHTTSPPARLSGRPK